MRSLFSDLAFRKNLIWFGAFNLLLYLFIWRFNSLVPFNYPGYVNDTHHFLSDPKAQNHKFNLISGLAQYDAQWYLKIAADGYTFSPTDKQSLVDKSKMQNLTFAFFPLYPWLIKTWLLWVKDVQWSAFITSQVLLVANFVSLYYVVTKFFSAQVALKTSWLVFLFPFSIFFRSYYAENLLLLLLIWFSYLMMQKKWLVSGILLSVINITKGTVVLLNVVYFVYLLREIRYQKINIRSLIIYLGVPMILPLGWVIFNYLSTGNPLFFYTVQTAWYHPEPFWYHVIFNLFLVVNFWRLPLHTIHFSQIDVITTVLTSYVLIVSRKQLPRILWWVSFSIFLTPLLVRDLAAFGRFQSISFPLFAYLASKTKGGAYAALVLIFGAGLLTAAVFFVNWYWIG
ncbi:MAG: glycosyltransferase family 39 protein [Firmicutes bacterium]|nr:glycosyltransferase family 39 protein [Bacillota bacterium]